MAYMRYIEDDELRQAGGSQEILPAAVFVDER
jgi:hypothetical protein